MKLKLLMTIFLVTSIFFNSNAEEYPPITISGDNTACTGEVYTYSVVDDPLVYYQWTNTNGTFVSSPTGSNSVDIAWYGPGSITVSTYSDPGFVSFITSATLSVSVDVLDPYITMEPEVGCLDEKGKDQKETFFDPKKEENDCNKACEDNPIKYIANGNAGSTFDWVIIGDGTPNTGSGPDITVTWNSVGFGVVKLIETSTNGCIEETEICVEIIPKPEALFDVLPGLTVCVGQTVYFEDLSQAVGDADLTAWEWQVSDGTFQAYTESTDFSHVFNSGGSYSVNLRVYNTCGCYDDYKVKIKVISTPGPDIFCPKVVCPNEKTVLSTSSTCGTYFWAVTNGTIVSGLGTQSITVMWDDVSSGVGYAQLAVPCGACNIPTVLEIPIVSTSLDIDGPIEACVGDQVTLTAPQIPGTFYNWSTTPPGAASIIEQANNQVIIQINSPTPITVEVVYNNELAGCGNGCGGNATHTLTGVSPSNVFGPKEVCVGDSENYFISGPATGSIKVEKPDGSSSTFSSGSTYTFTVDGVHVFTPNNAGCQGPPLVVNAFAIPAPPDVITGPDNVCPGIPYEYEVGNDINGTIYSWSAPAGTPNSGVGKNFAVSWSGPGPYVLTVSRINIQTPNCESSTISKTINPLSLSPGFDISTTVVCPNQSYTYSLDYNEGEEYSWTILPETRGSVITDPNNETVSILWNNSTIATSATIIGSVRKCNTWYDVPLNISINPVNNVTFSASSNLICQNETVSFGATAGYSIYDWTISPAMGGPIPNSPNFTRTFTSSGTFNVTLVATDVCGNVSIHSEVITVLPEPPSQLSITSNTITCTYPGPIVTGSATLVTSVIGGTAGHTFAWNIGGPPTPTRLVTSTGVYTVTVTNTATGCKAVETIKIKCPPKAPCSMPSANTGTFDFTYDNMTCGEVEFNETSVTSAFGWTYLGGTFKHFGTNAFNEPGPNFTYSSFDVAGYYDVIYQMCFSSFSGTCCKNITQSVPIPIVAEAEATAFCDGSGNLMIQLDDFSSTLGNLADYDVTWSIPGMTIPAMPNVTSGTTSVPTSLAPGIYPVVLSVFVPMVPGVPGMPTDYQCEYTTSVLIPALPDATFTNNSLVCEDLDVEFLAISGFTSYAWDFDDGSTLLQTTNTAARKYDGPLAGGYQVTLTVTNSAGCTDTYDDFANVVENDFALPVIDVLPSGPICKPNPATLSFNHSGTAVPTSFDWSDFATGNPNVVFEAGGYIVTATDTYGCVAVTDLTPVDIRPSPSSVIFGDAGYCYDDDLPVRLFGYAGPGFTYLWRKKQNGGAFFNLSTGDNITDNSAFPWGSPYEYELTVTDPLTGCSAVTVKTVDIYAAPPSPGVTDAVTLCNPYSVELTATSTVASPTFNWSNGDNGTPITVLHGGLYEVTLTDLNGCTSTTLVDIEGEPNLDFFPVGCYVYCREDMPLFFPGPYGNFDSWKLYLNGSVIQSGSGPISNLAITNQGDHWLEVTNNGCVFKSGIMNVKFDEKKCDMKCDKPCSVKVDKIYPEHIQDCLYEFSVDVYLGECTTIDSYNWTINGVSVPGGAVMSYVFPGPGAGYEICVVVIGIDENGKKCKDVVCIEFEPTCKCDCDVAADFDIIQENCEFKFIGNITNSKCTKVIKIFWTLAYADSGEIFYETTNNEDLYYGFNTNKPIIVCMRVIGSDGQSTCEDIVCKTIFPCNQEGGSDEDSKARNLEEASISVSPNPVFDKLRIDSQGSMGKEWSILIVDATGRMISNTTIDNDQSFLIISTDGWNSGMYHLSVSDELGNRFSQKIIKVD